MMELTKAEITDCFRKRHIRALKPGHENPTKIHIHPPITLNHTSYE